MKPWRGRTGLLWCVACGTAALFCGQAGVCGQAAANPARPAEETPAATTDPVGTDPVWKDKPIPEWTETDAKQILKDSPWVKTITPLVDKTDEKKTATRPGFGLGRFGRHREGNNGEQPGASSSSADGSSSSSAPGSGSSSGGSGAPAPIVLTLRWESALPVREAELKARDVRAPAVDEDHYAIAVYGVPSRLVNDSKKDADRLKSQAAIKRNAKEDLKPSSVEVMMRDDGPVILYLFPRAAEITWRDHQIEFDARVGNLKISQGFAADDMRFHGTLEL